MDEINRQQLSNSKSFKFAVLFLIFLASISLTASIIANDKPLFVKAGSGFWFPAFSGETYYNQDLRFADLAEIPSDTITVIMPPVWYAPGATDIENSGFKSPGQTQFKDEAGSRKMLRGWERHHLGTGKRGEDILSGLIHGTRISLSVGIYCAIIAGFIGILLGCIAGYFGDRGISIPRGVAFTTTLGLLPAWFYAFNVKTYLITAEVPVSTATATLQTIASILSFASVVAIFALPGLLLNRIPFLKSKINLPIDWIISRVIEIVNSLPRLIIIISIAAVSRPSMANIILLIGLTYWTEIARITRSEIMRIRGTDYIASAKSSGASPWRILFKQALPNALPVITVSLVACMASAILTESSLSFLGLGVPVDIVTWGSLLAGAREQFDAWWLVVFPGAMVFLTILSLNKIADTISSRN
ncbi:MAG: ABC transporter permease [Bacteroidota bacterium]